MCLAEDEQASAGSSSEADADNIGDERAFATVPLDDQGLSCRAEVGCLEPGTDYLLRVFATNDQGSSVPSEVGA